MIRRSALTLADLDLELALRSCDLMARYRDHPMDLADATLVALAEASALRTIFTLDEHFRSYRLPNSATCAGGPELAGPAGASG
jgi:predicted nucleic acid-binding protein